MESEFVGPKIQTKRHKCVACYKQFKRKEHLIEHMKISYHSAHQPICEVCRKHCKSFESVREHLTGKLANGNCSSVFTNQGCSLCLRVFDSANYLSEHKDTCQLSAPIPLVEVMEPHIQYKVKIPTDRGSQAIAIDCEMVGGGEDGSLNLCARVCLIDEDENLIFHSYVQPQVPVTDYRYEVTGITEELLKDSTPLKGVQEKILEILCNGEPMDRVRLDGSKARLLVGHDLEHDLNCLRISYSGHLLRDTAKYRPLMKTNLVSHSLKYLTKTYLGYDIQIGTHNPYEDCVSVMRLYKRMHAQDHHVKGINTQNVTKGFDSWKSKELEKMTPEELYEISKLDYKCWCLDKGNLSHTVKR